MCALPVECKTTALPSILLLLLLGHHPIWAWPYFQQMKYSRDLIHSIWCRSPYTPASGRPILQQNPCPVCRERNMDAAVVLKTQLLSLERASIEQNFLLMLMDRIEACEERISHDATARAPSHSLISVRNHQKRECSLT